MRATFQILAVLIGALAGSSPTLAQAPGMFTGDDDDYFRGRPYLEPLVCIEITDHRVREAVREEGFTDIYLNARHDRGIQVRATQGGWVYLLQVSTCTGWILYGQRLRPAA